MSCLDSAAWLGWAERVGAALDVVGGVFSWPWCFSGVEGAPFCKTLSSTKDALVRSASQGWMWLPFPGDRALATDCGRPRRMGVSKAVSFGWASWAWGSSLAPGGKDLLLGLPRGVLAGSTKVFLTGVWGRPRSILLLLSLPPGVKGLVMKLAMSLSSRALVA